MIKKAILALLFVSSLLLANKTVSATAIIDRADYEDKSMQNLQLMAMQQAKLEAASQLFGDFIKSQTLVKDGSLVKDLILAKQGGVVHIEGDPVYENGANLGELKVSINAYATDQDVKDMTIQRLQVKNFMYSNPNLNLKQLEQAAKDNFLIGAIAQKKPSIKSQSNALELAKKLAVSVKIESMDFNADWMAYKLSGYVEYVPIFLRNANDKKALSFKMIQNSATLTIYSFDNNVYTHDLKHSNKGFGINEKILKQLKKSAKIGSTEMIINAKILVPESIKGEEVTIKLQGTELRKGGYASYTIRLNNQIMDEQKIDAYVIHNEGKRYVNLSIRCHAGKGYYKNYFLKSLIPLLKKMYFSVSGDAKDITATLGVLKSANEKNSNVTMRIVTKKSDIIYDINNHSSGFILTKKILKTFKKNVKKGLRTNISFSAKLLIPKSIESDNITLIVNGAPFSYNGYSVYSIDVNGEKMDEYEIDTKVINGDDYRYVNVRVNALLQSSYYHQYFFSNTLPYLGTINFSLKEEDDSVLRNAAFLKL